MYRDYAKSGAQLALVVALIAGSVLLLSAAGIHALMSFTVTQRRREIGIRTALGAPAHGILTSVLARATRQLSVGVALGLVVAVAGDVLSGGELMNGTAPLPRPRDRRVHSSSSGSSRPPDRHDAASVSNRQRRCRRSSHFRRHTAG